MARSTCRSQHVKDTGVRTTFGRSEGGRRKGLMAGVGHLKRICKDAFPWQRDMFIRAVRRGWILEHLIFSFGNMILRDRCSTSYDLASLFRGRRSTLDRWSGKIAKPIGTRGRQLCTQLSIFEGCLGSLAELLRF